jgi:hypothetical protein
MLPLLVLLQRFPHDMDHHHRFGDPRPFPSGPPRVLVLVPAPHDGKERYAIWYGLLGLALVVGSLLYQDARRP